MRKIFGLSLGYYYVFIFASLTVLFGFLIFTSISPEERILGSWEEIAWEYEKVDMYENNGKPISKSISQSIKQEIIESLIIHEAETWEFLPDGTLKLDRKDKISIPLEWNLKGRGHVLKLKHPDNKTEHYNLQRINNDEMVLYFNSDIKAKGIVKMTFKKINS